MIFLDKSSRDAFERIRRGDYRDEKYHLLPIEGGERGFRYDTRHDTVHHGGDGLDD